MVKIKTFTNEIKIFQTRKEIAQLDELANKYISDNNVKKVISVSDTCTTDQNGATIGIIRTVAYEE